MSRRRPAAPLRSDLKPDRELTRREAALAASNAIDEIDDRDEQQDDALVAAFLCAAWPSALAQNQ